MRINENKEFTVNQISNDKPNVPRSKNVLTGYIANSMNAGHNRTIAFKQVMAGERIQEYKIQAKFKTLTPLTAPFQQLKCTIRSYFVPNSRVWEDAEKYTAQKGGAAETKVKEIPNTGGRSIKRLMDDEETYETQFTNTTAWRDAFISCYYPRFGTMKKVGSDESIIMTLPKISILTLRGRVAIYNDYERNKEFDEEKEEFKSTTVSNKEWVSYFPGGTFNENDFYNMRAKRPNSYYTNYRTEIQGFEETYPPLEMSADKSLITWAQWEHKIAEARSQAENAQRNPWEIIAELRGSKVALQGKVQIIGEKTFNLNYAAVTQNSYNNSSEVQNENFKVLGQQGGYSYTEIEMPCFAGWEAIEEGYIHIIATVWAESVFESGIDRLELNVTPLDQYRPDLVEEKHDVLYEIECGTKDEATIQNMQAIGFKRKFSEYFKLPNVIAGDLTNDNYYETKTVNEELYLIPETEIQTHNTYQFFETDMNYYQTYDGAYYKKKEWKDYSDLLMNKNLAIQQEIEEIVQNGDISLRVKGQNQIFLVGKCICVNDAPIDESIKSNFTTWGEH